MPKNTKSPSVGTARKDRAEQPLTQFHQNCSKILKLQALNLEIAEGLGIEVGVLNELWKTWNDERPVHRFADFVKNENGGACASANEINELLNCPSEDWNKILNKDKQRRYHRALGCISTNDAISALKKRKKLKEVEKGRPIFR